MQKKSEKKISIMQIISIALEVQRTRNNGISLKDCVKEVKEAEKEARAK